MQLGIGPGNEATYKCTCVQTLSSPQDLSLSLSLSLSYDLILVEGLPDWRQPIFYYRRVRKMGLLELTALLMVIGSVGQYLFGLAVYVEKKLVMVRARA